MPSADAKISCCRWAVLPTKEHVSKWAVSHNLDLSIEHCQSILWASGWSTGIVGVGIAQWLEHRTRDWKLGVRIPATPAGEFSSPGSTFCADSYFGICSTPPPPPPPPPRVTAVAHKRSRSFCQKCRWQVTAKHAYTLHMWLCMKWHGAWLYGVHRTCAETAAVSCGTSRASTVSTPLRCILKNI